MGRKNSPPKLSTNAVSAAGAGGRILPGSNGPLAAPPASAASPPAPPSSQILPLTSTSDVYTPPRARDLMDLGFISPRGFMKFSFDFPEPSVTFDNLQFSFRLFTYENAFSPDPERMKVEEKSDGLEITCSQLTWAGGQEKAPGRITARIRKKGSYMEWDVGAETEQPIKSIATIVRGVPRGKISAGGQNFFDPKDEEVLVSYPFGTGDPTGTRGVGTPLVVIQQSEENYFFLSALNQRVRANRFYLQPGETAYRAELVFEREGWKKSNHIESCVWRAGRSTSLEGAFRPHYEHLEKVFHLPDWETREDVPAWLRQTQLVVSLHGMHWTGFVFNDFARMLEILQWVATKIPAERVLVFIPAWDGRYYWNYPLYEPDRRLGGAEGFRSLIQKGHAMGFRFMPMFGANSANRLLPSHSKYADGETLQIDGDPYYINRVDWDNDRHSEGWMPFMNLGVTSWRQWLFDRISESIDRYQVDAYFLDISGRWVNNPRADMAEGTRKLVEDLRAKYPSVLACGEYYHDAQLGFIPLHHIFDQYAYPAALLKYGRVFQHLSHPAPGRGSSGVHESGFRRFNPQTLSLDRMHIPTITVVDDTFERYRHEMEQIIRLAREREGSNPKPDQEEANDE
jgi:hypothetical protein